MKENFNPIKGQSGEFRVSLNLTELGDRAWEILSISQQLGFDNPQFKTCHRSSGSVEIWAIILQQFHRYDVDTHLVVDVWDDQLDQLRQAVGMDNEFSLIVLYNFAEYLQPLEAIA